VSKLNGIETVPVGTVFLCTGWSPWTN